MNVSFFVSVGSALLGAILIIAGYSKLRALDVFVASIAAYDVIPRRFHNLLAHAIVANEITVGIMLLAGLWSRWVLIASSLLLVAFLAANTWGLATGRDVECHCFGVRDKTPIRVSTLRSGGLAFLAIILALLADAALPHVLDQALVLLTATVIGIIATLAAMLMESIWHLVVRMKPERRKTWS